MPDDLKDLDNLKPIDHAVVAKPHTPVYKMHRYFARRPWSVFRALIEHYSNPGSIVLDPFCGGGVTVVEGLRLGRKVIGVDLNPLATFITRMEVIDVDLDELKAAFEQVETACREKIEKLYLTTCPKCGEKVPADWFEWSSCYSCPSCGKRLVCAQAKKKAPGEYRCPHCQAHVTTTESERTTEEIVRLSVSCDRCKTRELVEPRPTDRERAATAEGSFDEMVRRDCLRFPDDVMPQDFELRRPYNQHCVRFVDFYTHRNLYAVSLLHKEITRIPRQAVRHLLLLNLTSLMLESSMLGQIKGGTVVKPAAHYWISDLHAEINVWRYFESRFGRALLKGKKYWRDESSGPRTIGDTLSDLKEAADCLIWNRSSTSVPLPDNSVDTIITDPPYGGNVMYAEMSDFWFVWLRNELGFPGTGLIDSAEEVVQTRAQGKGPRDYRELMSRVFKECYRVLKPGRWLVMTFHNREFKVWNAIHLAAHDAGFVLAEQDGMIYQPPIQQYTTTIYLRRDRAMLGDFILSFQKREKPPKVKQIEHAEIGRQIERLAAEAVMYHRAASLSTIYMKLMPWLLNKNLLDKMGEKEVVPFLRNNFEEKAGLWYVKEKPGAELLRAMEEYSQQHYKASYEQLNFVPVLARIEYLVKRLLYERGYATQDEILIAIYTNLINSNMAEAREINLVLNNIAQLVPLAEATGGTTRRSKGGRKVWKLKEDIERENLWGKMGADVKIYLASTEESDHDMAIERLVEIAGSKGLKAHIGETEQTKCIALCKLSSPLPQRVQGMPKAARDIIEQIDVIWHNGGKGIVAAFEVERTTTITSGIDRFRNLLTAAPESEVELYLVVPKSRGNEVRNKLGSPANRKDGLHKKIGYIYLEDLDIRHADAAVDFEKIRRFINGGEE